MRQIVLTEQEIHEIVKDFGSQFTKEYKDAKKAPVFIGIMKGALPFMMDLMKEIHCPALMDFMQVSSYMGTESTGVIKLKKDISLDITNRDVIIIEDIVDSGNTLVYLKDYLSKNYAPSNIRTCVLLDKKCKRKVPFEADYVGKEIGDFFIVGYGLDYDEYFRNEKEIFVPTKEEIDEINIKNETK